MKRLVSAIMVIAVVIMLLVSCAPAEPSNLCGSQTPPVSGVTSADGMYTIVITVRGVPKVRFGDSRLDIDLTSTSP